MEIRAYLRASGLTLAQFAAKVGVSPAAMGRYAAGKRRPRPEVMARIERASGGRIRPNDLFGAEGAPEAAPDAAAAPYAAIDLIIPDLNGTIRGKRIAAAELAKALAGRVRLPGSVFGLDITGTSVLATGLVWEIGDADQTLVPADGVVRPVPWAAEPTGQLLMTMVDDGGRPFFGDPRQVLARVAERFAARGLTPVVAVELEFYLLDRERDARGFVQAPISPLTGARDDSTQVYGLEEIDAYRAVFDAIAAACAAQAVPASTAVAEYAPAQYEVNLAHVPDPVLAGDHGVLLKRIVRNVARRHGLDATFMAKPFAEQTGNGLHLHVSLVDDAGHNLFADPEETVNAPLRHALGGLRATMKEAMAIFAPNANSYRRLQPASYAPLAPSWGYENRTVALRVPGGRPEARRIEHRVAGADANIYLTIAAVLAGIDHGLEHRLDPGERTTGNAYEKVPPSLPNRWVEALAAFEAGAVVPEYLGSDFCRLYAKVKRAEMARFEAQVTPLELAWYLSTV